MKIKNDKIEELLELGIGMGPGKRYLLVYEGELAITNRIGLANWPPGRREIVTQLDATDCLHGPTSRKWDEICEKLHAIESRKINDTESPVPMSSQVPLALRLGSPFVSAQGEGGLFAIGAE